MYKVIKFFTDLQDGDHSYSVGDTFPREGVAVTDTRIAELAGCENKQGVPLIQKAEESKEESEEKPKKAATRKPRAAKK